MHASKKHNPDPADIQVQALDHLDQMRKVSLALTRNRADAEDLVQDTFVRAIRAAARFRAGTNLRAWLLTILRNLASNHRRDKLRRRAHLEVDHAAVEIVAPHASPEQALLSRTIGPQLQTALESLPKALRDAVWLRDVGEMSYADIARRLRIPIGTVMSRISRGRRLLHDRLVELNDGGPRPPAGRSRHERL